MISYSCTAVYSSEYQRQPKCISPDVRITGRWSPEESDGYAALEDGLEQPGGILSGTWRTHAEQRSRHVSVRLLHRRHAVSSAIAITMAAHTRRLEILPYKHAKSHAGPSWVLAPALAVSTGSSS